MGLFFLLLFSAAILTWYRWWYLDRTCWRKIKETSNQSRDMACKISLVYFFSLLWQTLHTKVKEMYTKDNHPRKMYKINFLPRFQSHLLGWDTIHIAYPCRSFQWGSTKVAWSSFLYIQCIVCLDTRTGTSSSIHLLILHDMNLAMKKEYNLSLKYTKAHKFKLQSFFILLPSQKIQHLSYGAESKDLRLNSTWIQENLLLLKYSFPFFNKMPSYMINLRQTVWTH